MFVTDLLGILRRRWYVVAVGLILTAAASIFSLAKIGPNYVSTSHVLLLPPLSSVPEGSNPLLSLNGMTSTVDVVARALIDESSLKRIAAAGSTAEFEAITDPTTSGPVLEITSTAKSQQESLKTLDIVTKSVPSALAALQSGLEVRQSAFITSTIITQDIEPKPVRSTQIRAVVASVAVCLFLTILAAAFEDALAARRRGRGESSPPDEGITSSTSSENTLIDYPAAIPWRPTEYGSIPDRRAKAAISEPEKIPAATATTRTRSASPSATAEPPPAGKTASPRSGATGPSISTPQGSQAQPSQSRASTTSTR